MSTRLLVRPIGSREGKKNIAEINLAWDYVIAIYSKSQENLSDLTQKSLKFFLKHHMYVFQLQFWCLLGENRIFSLLQGSTNEE